MGFQEEFKSNAVELLSVYDLAAFCYDYLISEIEDQELFIGKYVLTNEKSGKRNPNIERLNRFSERVKRQLLEYDSDSGHAAVLFGICTGEIEKAVLKIKAELVPYGDSVQNEATIPLYILYAVDRYLAESKMLHSERSPRNRHYCQKSHIYRAPKYNILDKASEKLRFPGEIRPLKVRDQLRRMIILEKRELPDTAPPDVVPLWISETDKHRRALPLGQKLKIALIPFEKAHMTDFPPMEGAVFRVEYTDWHKSNGIAKALRLLDMAIEQQANVIIFPEFVCYPQLQDAIKKRLQEIHKRKPMSMKNLLLVVAGSGWTEDNNNVACIYSYDGKLLGKQYKDVRFNRENGKGEGFLEGLTTPGYRRTICEVEGIGQIMAAICRDVSERGHIRELAKIFRPQFLLVPAWSPSVQNGFKEQFCEITAQNHRTCSILCNCCEAFGTTGEKREINGIVVTPCKEGSLVRGKVEEILRNEACWEDGSCGGCIFILNLAFQPDAVDKQKIVQKIMQKK